MTIAASILPEFEHEMAGTRKVLQRVPNDKLNWKAHPKSNTIGWVAAHLVEIPGWVEGTLTQTSWDINPVGGEPYGTPPAESREQLLALFDKNVAAARKAIAATSDQDFMVPWSLLSGGDTLITIPRIAVIRTFVLNHAIHHRAILCVYLRLNDIPVPALYGNSGDEQWESG
ncbi:MAG: DinB family protein [Pirellulales bacterium]